MNYDRIYQELMVAAKPRGTDKSKLDGYYELHHILPKCLGSSEDEANLVLLTAREHFVAHRLLAKSYPGNSKLLFAVSAFSMGKHMRYLTSRQVALAREAYSAALSQRNAQLAAEGRHPAQTVEFREALSQRQAQLAAEGKHPAQTAEAREAQSRRMAAKATCPYCGKVGGATAMRRWHFENCKLLKEAKAGDSGRLSNSLGGSAQQ